MSVNNGHAEDVLPEAQLPDFVGEPWDMQPTETDKAFLAFRCYRDLGPGRTLLDAERVYREQVNGAVPAADQRAASGQFTLWSRVNRWRDRANAWDVEQDRVAINAQRRARIKMAERHAQHAEAAQRVLMAPVEEFLKRMARQEIDFAQMPQEDLVKLVRLVVTPIPDLQKSERLALGADKDDLEQFADIAERALEAHVDAAEARVVELHALPALGDVEEGEVTEG